MALLSMDPSMFQDDGDGPIQYKVEGLPPGHEALIGKDDETDPPGWKIRLRRIAGGEWADLGNGHYETPADALAVLQAAFPG
jgi:hypothetical protein